MTTKSKPEYGKTQITAHSTYRKEDRGSLDAPLRLISEVIDPIEYSYVEIGKVYLVPLILLKPLTRKPPMLSNPSFWRLQERTATLREAFNHDVHREELFDDHYMDRYKRPWYRHLTPAGARGPTPGRGSLVKYGREPRLQSVDKIRKPCSNGVFLVASTTGSDFDGIVWAYPVRISSCFQTCLNCVD